MAAEKNLIDQRLEFLALFGAPTLDGVYDKALAGELRTSQLRSLSWKVFWGILPRDSTWSEWCTEITESRQTYEKQRKELLIDPRQAEELDPTINNPLSMSEESPWTRFFKNTELEKTIELDLTRMNVESEILEKPEVREALRRVLFIWASNHPKISYRQGMHELLALLTLVVYREARPAPPASFSWQGITKNEGLTEDQVEGILSVLLSESQWEHDAFLLFSSLMDCIGNWFLIAEKPQAKPSSDPLLSGSLFGMDQQQQQQQAEESLPIIRASRQIQCDLLKDRDPNLFHYLDKLKIEPQLYALRWLRLLFGREFHVEDSLVLWDAMFAYGKNMSLALHISVCMLIFIRTQLLERDSMQCMRRLMKYPPVEDVHIFVDKALQSVKGKSVISFGPPPTPTPPSDPLSAPPASASAVAPTFPVASIINNARPMGGPVITSKSGPTLFGTKSVPASYFSSEKKETSKTSSRFGSLAQHVSVGGSSPPPFRPTNSASASASAPMVPPGYMVIETSEFQKAEALKKMMSKCSTRLEKIIGTLQTEICSGKEKWDEDAVFLSVAEIKQVKDVLKLAINDILPDDDEEEENQSEIAPSSVQDRSVSPSDPLGSSSPVVQEEREMGSAPNKPSSSSEDPLGGTILSTPSPATTTTTTTSAASKLFGDDDSLFSDTPQELKPATPKSQQKKISLFDEDEDF